MPNRIIKESICTSDTIDGLSEEAENFFYRLVVNCDDYGLFDARPAVLRARLYPLRVEKISLQWIVDRLAELVTGDPLIQLYAVEGRPYLRMLRFTRHQQVRAKRAKFPAPSDGKIISPSLLLASDINCAQTSGHASGIQSNPIQSEPESYPESEPEPEISPAGEADVAIATPPPNGKPPRRFFNPSDGETREAYDRQRLAIAAAEQPGPPEHVIADEVADLARRFGLDKPKATGPPVSPDSFVKHAEEIKGFVKPRPKTREPP